jgi:hypothetical protein
MGARAQAKHFTNWADYDHGKPIGELYHYRSGDEVWGLNACWLRCCDGLWTRFFNLHTYENLKRYNYDVERDISWVKSNPHIDFYTIDYWPGLNVANAFMLPRTAIAEDLKRHRVDYHCGSFDWMLAYAMSGWKFDEIILHGVSLLIEPGEPISARSCLEYWIGVAEGRGIQVTCAPDCDLFAFIHMVKSNLVYGYDDTPVYEDRTRDLKGEPPYEIAERGHG